MNITVSSKPVLESVVDALVIFAWKKSPKDQVIYSMPLDDITSIATEEGFDASVGKVFLVHTHGNIQAKKILIAGIGVLDQISVSSLQKTGAHVARKLKESKSSSVAISIDASQIASLSYETVVQSIVEGVQFGDYTFTNHKTVRIENEHVIASCEIVVSKGEEELAKKAVMMAIIVAGAVAYTRDLVNEPPSFTTPTYLAEKAQEIAKGNHGMVCTVFNKSDLEKMKMGGILAIARGTDVEPKFIKLEYNGGGAKTIALIGKGITFDTGGLSLKDEKSMETMKMDMAGAAAVLGVFSALCKLRPSIHVVGLISATENMPGPNAVKPGDIVTAKNGKTIEILNTDAEGRVVLADALSYAVSEIKPDIMIDLATLTGACVVALGEEVTGLFSNSQPLADALLASGVSTGESLWQLPLTPEYRDHIKSTIADVKNLGNGRWGGAITAALFLQEFTDDSIPWVHLDIAGPAFAEKDMIVSPYGGTGHGVRLLISYLLSQK